MRRKYISRFVLSIVVLLAALAVYADACCEASYVNSMGWNCVRTSHYDTTSNGTTAHTSNYTCSPPQND